MIPRRRADPVRKSVHTARAVNCADKRICVLVTWRRTLRASTDTRGRSARSAAEPQLPWLVLLPLAAMATLGLAVALIGVTIARRTADATSLTTCAEAA